MNRNKAFYFILFFLFVGNYLFGQRLIYDPQIPVEKVRVVLEQTRGGTISEMLSDLEYIPLRSSKTDVIDDILDMQILGDKLGILSLSKGYFYLYSIDGALITKITEINAFAKQDKETPRLFTGLSKEGEFFMLDHPKFKVKVDINGRIIDTISSGSQSIKKDAYGQEVNSSIRIGEVNYEYLTNFYDTARTKQDILLRNGLPIIQYNELDTVESRFTTSPAFSKVFKDRVYLTIPFHYKLFVLNEGGIRSIYDFVFPLKNTIPTYQNNPAMYKNINQTIKHLINQPNAVFGIGGMLEYRDYLILFVGRFQNPTWLAYDLKTKETISFANIVATASNDFLDYYNIAKVFVDEDYLYSFIYPSQVRAAINKCADERHTMRKEYRELEKSNNPILVRFKLK